MSKSSKNQNHKVIMILNHIYFLCVEGIVEHEYNLHLISITDVSNKLKDTLPWLHTVNAVQNR